MKEQQNDEQLLQQLKEHFVLAEEAWRETFERGLSDLKFAHGDQWEEDILRERSTLKKPCLTINKIPGHVKQITNDQRQNRPAIQVTAVEDNDVDTAEVIQGLVRHIENRSKADHGYDTGFRQAVETGFGALRVITEFESPKSNDQVIRIQRIRNQFSVLMDPTAQEPDFSDAEFGFIVSKLTTAQHKRLYPKSQVHTGGFEFSMPGDRMSDWVSTDQVRVVEYFYRTWKDRETCRCEDGKDYWADEVPEGRTVISSRMSKDECICWVKSNGAEILERAEWPGKFIPIIPILGDETDIDGKRELAGIVRHAQGPQRMYNYWASCETEMIALAPKAPWVIAEGQIEGYKDMWLNANTRNYAAMIYKPKALGEHLLPPPSRSAIEPAVAAITQARMLASDDLKSTTGIYDAALGNKSNEQTGRAILARQAESDTSNFHFVDNLTRAIRHVGLILVDLIPKVYDNRRVLRITGKDEQERTVTINEPFMDEATGEEKIYDLSVGEYDVTVSVGPSYGSKRMQAAAAQLELVRSAPGLMEVAGDLIIKNFDWPGSQAIAARVKKALDPRFADDEQQQIPPQVAGQMQRLAQANEMLTAELQASTQAIQQKQLELQAQMQLKQMEHESREKIAALQARVEMAKLEMQQAGVLDIEQFRADRAMLQKEIDLMASAEAAERQHEMSLEGRAADAGAAAQMADRKHAQAVDMADRKHYQTVDMSDRSHMQAVDLRKHDAQRERLKAKQPATVKAAKPAPKKRDKAA